MVKTVYQTSDGKVYEGRAEAERQQTILDNKAEDAYKRFFKTYNGQELMSKHALHEVGTWEVLGEDPNCDLGGHHSTPHLFIAHGKLDAVIRRAVITPGFWQWGSGGEIRKVVIEEI